MEDLQRIVSRSTHNPASSVNNPIRSFETEQHLLLWTLCAACRCWLPPIKVSAVRSNISCHNYWLLIFPPVGIIAKICLLIGTVVVLQNLIFNAFPLIVGLTHCIGADIAVTDDLCLPSSQLDCFSLWNCILYCIITNASPTLPPSLASILQTPLSLAHKCPFTVCVSDTVSPPSSPTFEHIVHLLHWPVLPASYDHYIRSFFCTDTLSNLLSLLTINPEPSVP